MGTTKASLRTTAAEKPESANYASDGDVAEDTSLLLTIVLSVTLVALSLGIVAAVVCIVCVRNKQVVKKRVSKATSFMYNVELTNLRNIVPRSPKGSVVAV